jgi:AraC-like DNA-binding protein
MNWDNHTVASYWARTHLHNAVRLGANGSQVLTQAALPLELLQEPKSRISARQLAAVVRAAWQVSNDELLGLTTGKIKVGVFTLLAQRIIQCKTLGEALREAVTFYNLMTDGVQFSFKVVAQEARFSIAVNHLDNNDKLDGGLGYGRLMIIELLLLIWHRFPSWLLGQVIPLKQINFEFSQPAHSDEYRLMFFCPCAFNSNKNELVFDARLLSLPVIQSQAKLPEYLSKIPYQWFRKPAFYESFTSVVLRFLEENVNLQNTSIESVAKQLHMTSRTLRRKLQDEGSGFQSLKDQVRMDLSFHLLSEGTLPMADVAQRVGFTEAAAFSRAFKQWAGMSPAKYRKMFHMLGE